MPCIRYFYQEYFKDEEQFLNFIKFMEQYLDSFKNESYNRQIKLEKEKKDVYKKFFRKYVLRSTREQWIAYFENEGLKLNNISSSTVTDYY